MTVHVDPKYVGFEHDGEASCHLTQTRLIGKRVPKEGEVERRREGCERKG